MPLIVIEGIDGCGKGEQIRLLRERFPDAALFKYPTKNFQMLNDYLEKRLELDPKSLFLLFLADIANEQKRVKEALDEGKLVILDRYVFSTIAYERDVFHYPQRKKIVEGIGYTRPDMVILLDITPEVSQERKAKQKQLDRYEEDRAYLAKVREAFNWLCDEKFLCDKWTRIDGSMTVGEVHERIKKALGK